MKNILDKELLVVTFFADAFEAGIAQDWLGANQITSYLEEKKIIRLNPAGGVELKVRTEDLISAKSLLEKQPY